MRSNVTKSSVNVAFGTNRSFARTRIAKSLCAFVLRLRIGAIAPLSAGERAGDMRDEHVMPPRHWRAYLAPVLAGGWYRNGRQADLGRQVCSWNCSAN